MFEDGFDAGAVEGVRAKVEQHHVAVGAVGDEFVAEAFEFNFQRFGVGDDLLLVLFEFGGGGLFEGDGQGGDGVVVGAALVAREDGEVDGAFEVVEELFAGLGVGFPHAFAVEDHGAAGAAEGFVGCGGDDVGVVEGGGDHAGGDEAGDVGHVDDEVGAAEVGDFAHSFVVD